MRIFGDQKTPRGARAVQAHPETATATTLQETSTAAVKSALAVEAPPESIDIAPDQDPRMHITVAPGPPEMHLDASRP